MCSVGFSIVRRVRLIIYIKAAHFLASGIFNKNKLAFKIPHRFVKRNIKKSSWLSSLQKSVLLQPSKLSKAPKKPSVVQVSLESLMVNHDLGRQNDEENWTGAKPERFGPERKVEGWLFSQERCNHKGRAGSTFFEILKKRFHRGKHPGMNYRITTTLPSNVQTYCHWQHPAIETGIMKYPT